MNSYILYSNSSSFFSFKSFFLSFDFFIIVKNCLILEIGFLAIISLLYANSSGGNKFIRTSSDSISAPTSGNSGDPKDGKGGVNYKKIALAVAAFTLVSVGVYFYITSGEGDLTPTSEVGRAIIPPTSRPTATRFYIQVPAPTLSPEEMLTKIKQDQINASTIALAAGASLITIQYLSLFPEFDITTPFIVKAVSTIAETVTQITTPAVISNVNAAPSALVENANVVSSAVIGNINVAPSVPVEKVIDEKIAGDVKTITDFSKFLADEFSSSASHKYFFNSEIFTLKQEKFSTSKAFIQFLSSEAVRLFPENFEKISKFMDFSSDLFDKYQTDQLVNINSDNYDKRFARLFFTKQHEVIYQSFKGFFEGAVAFADELSFYKTVCSEVFESLYTLFQVVPNTPPKFSEFLAAGASAINMAIESCFIELLTITKLFMDSLVHAIETPGVLRFNTFFLFMFDYSSILINMVTASQTHFFKLTDFILLFAQQTGQGLNLRNFAVFNTINKDVLFIIYLTKFFVEFANENLYLFNDIFKKIFNINNDKNFTFSKKFFNNDLKIYNDRIVKFFKELTITKLTSLQLPFFLVGSLKPFTGLNIRLNFY